MRIFISLCVVLSLLSEDFGRPLYAFEGNPPPEIKIPPILISLEEAVARVKEIHPDLKLQELALERAKEEVRFATRSLFPDIESDYIASAAAGGLGLILAASRLLKPLFSLRDLLAERKVRKLLKEREEVKTRLRELEVIQGVKEFYTSLLVEERLAFTFHRDFIRAERRFRLKKVLYRKGRLTREDYFKEKFALEKARKEKEAGEILLVRHELAFRDLLGLPKRASFSLNLPDLQEEAAFPLSLEECFALAQERSPLIRAFRLEEEASVKEKTKGRLAFQADGFFVGFGESGDLFQGRPRMGFSGNLVLYDWGKKGIQKRILDLGHQSLLWKHRKELGALKQTITKDYSETLLLFRESTLQAESLRLREETRRRVLALYRAGRASEESLLEALADFELEKARGYEKKAELFLARERLVKDLGLSGMKELREVLGGL